MKKLTQQVAMVTGGSRGIGAAIAKRLAKEGADVAITYRTSADQAKRVVQEIQEQGGKAIAIQADGTDTNAIQAAVDRTAKEFGSLSILINNAGIAFYEDISNLSLEDYDRMMSINVRAVFAGSKAALPYLSEGGRIISIGSCQADRMPTPGGSLYAMSKAALTGLTKGMARDLGPKGITVNLVQPGPVDTDMNPADGPFADDQRSLLALSEFGNGDDIAALVAFLASAESRYITGASFTIDGGTNC